MKNPSGPQFAAENTVTGLLQLATADGVTSALRVMGKPSASFIDLRQEAMRQAVAKLQAKGFPDERFSDDPAAIDWTQYGMRGPEAGFLRAWAFRIGYTTVANDARRDRRWKHGGGRPQIGLSEINEPPAPPVVVEPDNDDFWNQVLARIPESRRDRLWHVLRLYVGGCKNQKTIAEVVGVSKATISRDMYELHRCIAVVSVTLDPRQNHSRICAKARVSVDDAEEFLTDIKTACGRFTHAFCRAAEGTLLGSADALVHSLLHGNSDFPEGLASALAKIKSLLAKELATPGAVRGMSRRAVELIGDPSKRRSVTDGFERVLNTHRQPESDVGEFPGPEQGA